MRVLMISLERSLFEDGQVRQRIVNQNKDLEHLTILVFGKQAFDQMAAPNVRVVSTASWFRLLYILDALHRLWFWRKEKFDVVTTDTVETAIVGVMAAGMFGAALAVQDHGYYFHGDYYRKESFLNRFLYLFMRWAVRRADAVRVVSVRTEKALISLGVPPEKIVRFPLTTSFHVPRTTYNIVPSSHRPTSHSDGSCPLSERGQPQMQGIEAEESTNQRSYILHDGRYFFLAARFVPIKRLDIAIHAFSLIAGKYSDVKLRLQGRGPLEREIRKKISEFGLEDRVELSPWGENLAEHYANALATLITSDREGFNMTAVESLLCGTPVIMTDVGCAGEVVKDGENGYVVPVGDVHALADRMERVLQNPHGLRENVKQFIWPAPAKNMQDFLETAKKNFQSRSFNSVRLTHSVQDDKGGAVSLLFVTQTVDKQDSVLGFVVRWLEEFVGQGVKLTVFARILKKDDLPPDVRGVEIGRPKVRRILKLWFYSIKYRREYDAVLVHMTPEILVLGWPIWFILRKKVCLWYIHPRVSWWLRLALVLGRNVFTATERSLNAVTPKKIVVGHGIETDVFKPVLENKTAPVILYVGRISPVKKLEDIIDLLSKYHSRYPNDQWIFSLVGSYAGHESYFDALKAQAARSGIADRVSHREPVAHDFLPEVFSAASVSVSATPTGSLDKVVLESLACGTPVMAAGKDYLDLAGAVDIFDERAPDRLHELLSNPRVDRQARESVIKKHDLKRLVKALIGHLSVV